MPLPRYWASLRETILSDILPTDAEREELKRFTGEVVNGLEKALRTAGIDASVEVHGSVSRDTWLPGVKDIDIFVVIDPSKDRENLYRVNEVVKGFVGTGWKEAYAEHPYIVARMKGYDVDFIPAFRLRAGNKVKSAVDRSPLHTGFVKRRLNEVQKNDVRLLKSLMNCIGIYGAEIKVGGFSGYLCELLIIKYGSFEELVVEASMWNEPIIIQLSRARSEAEIRKRLSGPLIVIDPVDRNRNVASAVTETSFWNFIQACRIFSSVPDRKFFFPPISIKKAEDVLSLIEHRGTALLFASVPDPNPPVPDTLWGLIFRAERGAKKSLEERGYKVIRSGSWSDEASIHVFTFEIESARLPPLVMKAGPPVRLASESVDFLSSHLESENTVSGPAIEGDRWWVLVKRSYVNADDVLRGIMAGEKNSSVPERISERFRSGGLVLVDEKVSPLLTDGFIVWLHQWLTGRPSWLE